jgi:IS30 family transposase
MNYYNQITEKERYIISHLRRQRYTPSQIARQIGRHRSSITREFKRNCNRAGVYRPSKAQEKTNGRRSGSRKKHQYTNEQMELVWKYIRRFWSPEQVSGRLKYEGLHSISHETIYRYIWRDKADGGGIYVNLRGAGKQRRKRYGAYDSRGQIASIRPISQRPAHVEERQEFDHWEIDTMMGSSRDTYCILTLVERKTGYTESVKPTLFEHYLYKLFEIALETFESLLFLHLHIVHILSLNPVPNNLRNNGTIPQSCQHANTTPRTSPHTTLPSSPGPPGNSSRAASPVRFQSLWRRWRIGSRGRDGRRRN